MNSRNAAAELAVETLPVDQLVPYARNSRTHSPEQIAQVAASIREFGFTNPVLIDAEGGIIAGHGRVMAARSIGLQSVPCIRLAHLTEAQRRAYVIADNKLALNAGWDERMLALEFQDLKSAGFDLELTGFDLGDINELLAELDAPTEGKSGADETPAPPENPKSKSGDVWILGKHRVMCGDSTDPEAVKHLMDGNLADLMHADPPYGMGFEAEGVANDDLSFSDLAKFQAKWWGIFLPYLKESASAYVWGWEDSLFDFYLHLRADKKNRITKRNYLIWDKASGQGINQESLRRYAPVTEHCLFFMLGEQGFSTNADNYWEGWEPLRAYLAGEVERMGWGPKEVQELTGVGMYSHWFTKSQWTMIPEKHYEKLRAAANGKAFLRPWGDAKSEQSALLGEHRSLRAQFYETRAYFDNTHDAMTDVWRFSRVTGDERQGHATPKPVAMMQRIMKSSLPDGGLCVEPFGGSGSTLMGAETTGRVCYTMELHPKYVDVIVRRWQAFTGKRAVLEATGEPFPATD